MREKNTKKTHKMHVSLYPLTSNHKLISPPRIPATYSNISWTSIAIGAYNVSFTASKASIAILYVVDTTLNKYAAIVSGYSVTSGANSVSITSSTTGVTWDAAPYWGHSYTFSLVDSTYTSTPISNTFNPYGPTFVSNLECCWDASVSASITSPGGVLTWADMSANSLTMTAIANNGGSITYQPTYTSGTPSYVTFTSTSSTGSGMTCGTTSIIFDTIFEIFIIQNLPAYATPAYIQAAMGCSETNPGGLEVVASVNGQTQGTTSRITNQYNAVVEQFACGLTGGVWGLQNIRCGHGQWTNSGGAPVQPQTSGLAVYATSALNNVVYNTGSINPNITSSSFGSGSPAHITLGCRYNSSYADLLNGSLALVMKFSRILSTAERTFLLQWMAATFGSI